MKFLIKRVVLLFAILGSSVVSFATNKSTEDVLKLLDKEISLRQNYTQAKLAKIDSLRNQLRSSLIEENLDSYLQLGDIFSSFNNDSALIYYTKGYDKALEAGMTNIANIFRMKRATFLPLAGYIYDAINEYGDIDPSQFTDAQLSDFYEHGRQMFSYISSTYTKYPETEKYFKDKSDSLRSKYLAIANPSSFQYKYNYSEALFDEGKYADAEKNILDFIDRMPSNSNLYARASYLLASIAKIKGNKEDEIKYLALSSMADIQGAVKEAMALQELGVIMSENEDIDRAYDYLSVALSNAVDCQAALRIVQTSEALPLIQDAYTEQMTSSRNKIFIIIIFLALILCVLVVLLFYLHRQMQEMKKLQERLSTSNNVKEIYISQFFRLCSIYIDKLNQFSKLVNRKISSGQTDDLYKMTKSGKLVEEQSAEFYKLFDDAFLHIYPNFVDDVNKLMREKLVLKEGELLNNDLRILAFLRLGLEDTAQVAQILNYSVNTIYAYRNKLRNRAYDRDNFEKNIMNISSI